jgi:alanine racemase
MEIQSTIIKVLDLKPDERVSYNGIYKAQSARQIAVLPLGYYEWVPRELSDKGFFTFKQTRLPIRGRVCMNHTMVDITGTNLGIGDKVCVVSVDNRLNSIQNYADLYKLFTYHLLTRTNENVRRTII